MQGSQTTPNSAPGSAGGSLLAGCRFFKVTPGRNPGLKRRRGFTLTELLVVIAIIGVLASLITAAAVNALRNAKRARIVLEIKQMATAAENLKADLGAYPPNGMSDPAAAAASKASRQQRVNEFQTMGKKLSSRIHPQEMNVLIALAGGTPTPPNITTPLTGGGLTAAEAVYFWLGGFSQDPQFPISGPGGPSFDYGGSTEVMEDRIRRYEFNLAQLGPRTEDGEFFGPDIDPTAPGRYVAYNVDLNGDGDGGTGGDAGEERRINLWQYHPSGSEQPFVYFDCSRNKPYQYDVEAMLPDTDPIYPFKVLRQGRTLTVANADADVVFKEAPKFQILHCGLDDAWGDSSTMRFQSGDDPKLALLFPTGPFTGDLADTLTNFTNGEVADEAEE